MGRIKTKPVKRATLQLFREHKQDFKTEFEANKAILPSLAEIKSKKIRNTIAGYLTRLAKQQQKQE